MFTFFSTFPLNNRFPHFFFFYFVHFNFLLSKHTPITSFSKNNCCYHRFIFKLSNWEAFWMEKRGKKEKTMMITCLWNFRYDGISSNYIIEKKGSKKKPEIRWKNMCFCHRNMHQFLRKEFYFTKNSTLIHISRRKVPPTTTTTTKNNAKLKNSLINLLHKKMRKKNENILSVGIASAHPNENGKCLFCFCFESRYFVEWKWKEVSQSIDAFFPLNRCWSEMKPKFRAHCLWTGLARWILNNTLIW